MEYKFIKIELSFFGRKPSQDYQKIIREEAESGWELVQIFAPAIQGYGVAAYFEIILKRKK